jgi:hypothetical protein
MLTITLIALPPACALPPPPAHFKYNMMVYLKV